VITVLIVVAFMVFSWRRAAHLAELKKWGLAD
jgi:hypothetical protein